MTTNNSTDSIRTGPKKEKDRQDFQAVCFFLAGNEYGIDVSKVQEIIRPIEVQELDQGIPFIKGEFTLRGQAVPLMDMRARLGFPESDIEEETRIVVVDVEDKVIGALVDSVTEVLRMDVGQIDETGDGGSPSENEVTRGVYRTDDKNVIILNCGRVFGT
jgi:purine-binding chemotaxis protein CheW